MFFEIFLYLCVLNIYFSYEFRNIIAFRFSSDKYLFDFIYEAIIMGIDSDKGIEVTSDEVNDNTTSNVRKNTVDMTVGNPTRHILLFALPLFIGNMFQQFYNLVDSIIVGKYINADALAATGACGSLNFLFFALSGGLAIGIGIIVSQYYGAGDDDKIRATISSSLYVLGISAAVVSLLGVLLARPILILLQTPEGVILEGAVVYLRTTCCGILFISFYNGVAAILRALGDSKRPLIFLIISAFLNIIMDLLFVIVFNWGIFGVAFATVVAQFISAAIVMIYAVTRVPFFKLSKEDLKPHRHIIARSFKLGVPLALQSSMIAISMIVLQGVVNSFGNVTMSAYTISAKVDLIISQVYTAISQAITTYAGQNFGAKKIDRVKGAYKRGLIFVLIYNIVMVPLVYIFSREIVTLFVKELPVIELGVKAEHITCIMYFALGFIYVPRGVLNGVGDAKFSLINGISEVICRVLYSFLLTNIESIGQMGIWWAAGLTWLTVAIICNIRYLIGGWKKLSLEKKGIA